MTTPKLPEGVYRRGDRLWIRDGIRRRRYREPVATLDPREAARIRRRRIEAHERGERTDDSDTLRMDTVLAAVLRDYEINGSRSLDTARGRVAALATARLGDGSPALGKRPALELTTDHVEARLIGGRRSVDRAGPNCAPAVPLPAPIRVGAAKMLGRGNQSKP